MAYLCWCPEVGPINWYARLVVFSRKLIYAMICLECIANNNKSDTKVEDDSIPYKLTTSVNAYHAHKDF